MKVGIIGLGRMGEGMSRRMIKAGIEVHGYRNNYEKNCKQYEAGYISGCTTSLENLVQVVHNGTGVFGDSSRSPGIFMMVVPAETVEDTLNGYYSFVWRAILLLIMAIVILKTLADGRNNLQNWVSNILTVVLAVVFTVWSVDTVLWLVVQILQYPSALLSLGHSHQASDLPLVQTPSLMRQVPSMVGYIVDQAGAGHFVKMVHNGVEYGIMQAYAEGFNILHEANAGAAYVKAGDAEVAPMENPRDYQYDIDCAEVAELWRRGSVVGSWLLDLTADVLRSDRELSKFDGGVSDSGEGRWTVHTAVDLGVPAPVISSALWSRFESRRLGAFASKVLNGMRAMFGGMMLGNALLWISIPFVLSTYISGYERVKMYTTTQTNIMATEPLTKGIVIFGATGDLCKRKLIPALYKLWLKDLLPENF